MSSSAGSASTGILHVTRHGRALAFPPDMPAGACWPYGMGVPFQLGPTTVAMFANIRHDTAPVDDLEVGSDLLIFDQLEEPARWQVQPMARMEFLDHPRHGQKLRTSKNPIFGGFVPMGALLADGTPHPHAGTGFGVSTVIGYPADDSAAWVGEIKDPLIYFEEQQYRYDGERFHVHNTRRIAPEAWLVGWEVIGQGLCNAVASGASLLSGMVMKPANAGADEPAAAGVSRWKCDADGQWRIKDFVPVTPLDGSMELSLVRSAGGELFATARACYPWRVKPGQEFNSLGVRIWRSRDEGTTWERVLAVQDLRPPTPVWIGVTTDGTIYVVMNSRRFTGPEPENVGALREILELRPLAPDGASLGEPMLVRDAPADFGPAPAKRWCFDHPVGATLRLGDGRWRHVLTYRGMDLGESAGANPTPATGLYVQEVTSRGGTAVTPWTFEANA